MRIKQKMVSPWILGFVGWVTSSGTHKKPNENNCNDGPHKLFRMQHQQFLVGCLSLGTNLNQQAIV
uniref:Secreted protein n=1 Tax=Rhizophora mucronata TaxID=61149 RepID=A0A2P2JYH3_RHIMU